MVSIHHSINALERCSSERSEVLECYVTALRNMAHYAIDLEERITAPHREYLSALAAEVSAGKPESWPDTRATLRGLLRDYRDKAAHYLGKLRDELTRTAGTLREIMDAVSQTEGDHAEQMRAVLRNIRSIASSPEAAPVAESLAGAASSMERSLEQLRQQHQFTVAQFLTEIRMLHKRIDALESAASIDDLTKLLNRAQMEDRVRGLSGGPFALLLIRAQGMRQAESTFNNEVAAELCGAFGKRLRNALPPLTVVARWSDEGFMAILCAAKPEAMAGAKSVAEQIGGPYACLLNGKAVRPSLQIRMAVVEHDTGHPDRVLKQAAAFLGSA
jgi:GGDEF domain-containing protein